MAYESIILEKENRVATITFNRPDKLNALNPQLVSDILNALDAVASDEDIRVLIVTGNGRGFCSGADLSGGSDFSTATLERRLRPQPFPWWGWLTLAFHNFQKPSIAAVNGLAVGGGLGIALVCDIRIAAESARFSSIFIQRALVPDSGATFYLPRVVGTSRAFEMMYTGDMVDAREAERIGLVSRVVPDEELLKTARELAARIAKMAPLTLELTKRAVVKGIEGHDFEAQLVYESLAQNAASNSEDYREAVQAFLEKREPQFEGR